MLKIEENEKLFLKVVNLLTGSSLKRKSLIKKGVLTEKQCSKIKSIELWTTDNMKGLENLTNLESLKIQTNFSIATPKIIDYSFLKSMPNLRTLFLNDPNTFRIDLSNNKKLIKVDIFSSREKALVEGLEKLDCFTSNKGKAEINVQANIKNLPELLSVSSKKNTKNMTLDYLGFARELHRNPNLLNMLKSKKGNISFRINQCNHIYKIDEALEIDRRISEIKKQLNFDKKNDLQKIMSVYQWIETHFTFNERGFDREDKSYSKKNDKLRDILPVLKAKKGVCVAFSNIFSYILQSEGIESVPVSVTINNGGGGHRIARIKDSNNRWLYFDPTFAIRPGCDWGYFALSQEQAKKCYTFRHEDHIISSEPPDRKILKEQIFDLHCMDSGKLKSVVTTNKQSTTPTIQR